MGTFAQGISGSNIVGYFINRFDVANDPVANGFLATLTPGLSITSSTNGVSLSWPYNPPATWVLQENASLTSTNWTPAPGVVNNGTTNSVTVTPSAQAMFFRLMLQ
jgi:hypothetical protein